MKRIETDTGYDGIQFETRREVSYLSTALEQWSEEHPEVDSETREIISDIAKILLTMWYEW